MKIGIEAPRSVGVLRREIYEAVKQENLEATRVQKAEAPPAPPPPVAGPRPGSARRPVSLHDEDGSHGVRENTLGDAAEQQSSQTSGATGPDDERVGAPG